MACTLGSQVTQLMITFLVYRKSIVVHHKDVQLCSYNRLEIWVKFDIFDFVQLFLLHKALKCLDSIKMNDVTDRRDETRLQMEGAAK